jgi:uncharacterized protein
MYRKRKILETLLRHKKNNKITILTGARQVGKTTLLKELYRILEPHNKSLFLDLDIFSNYEKANTYENLLNTLKLNGYRENREDCFYLFLDEFQRYPDISIVLKNIYDHHKNIKVYASGSSSLVINKRIQESLAGRKHIVNIYPLSFKEFLYFRERSDVLSQLENISSVSSEKLNKLIPQAYQELDQFMIYGGYPEVVLVKEEDKKDVLASIFDLYVSKDLVDYLKIEKIKNAKTFIKLLAVNNGGEVKFNSIGQAAGINEKTVRNYIELLKETFLINVITPWFSNRDKEIVKMPKIYFFDSGVRNFFVNNFNPMDMRSDASYLFEGFIISELINNGEPNDLIKFWRTKNKYEVDIILERFAKPLPIEIKFKNKLSSGDFKGIRHFRSAYPDSGSPYMINLYNNTIKNDIKLLSPFELSSIKERR